MEPPTIAVEWKGQEFEFVPKSSTWYWTVGILSVGSAIAALIADNFLFAVILLLAGGTVSLLGSRRPAMHSFRISNRGIHVGEQVFPYDNISRFAIHEAEPKKLLFELKQAVVKVMTIPLDGVDHRAVRTELKNHGIDEAETLDTLTARFSDWMGIG